jgi:hypothetical protein
MVRYGVNNKRCCPEKKKNKYAPKLKRFNVCTYMQNKTCNCNKNHSKRVEVHSHKSTHRMKKMGKFIHATAALRSHK